DCRRHDQRACRSRSRTRSRGLARAHRRRRLAVAARRARRRERTDARAREPDGSERRHSDARRRLARSRNVAGHLLLPGRRSSRPLRAPHRPAVIEVENLTKRFGPTLAVDDLSFTVSPGTVTGFLGPNGAGKSTTLRAVLGLVVPDAGTTRVLGRPYLEL